MTSNFTNIQNNKPQIGEANIKEMKELRFEL